METIDCGIFSEWEYDEDFINVLDGCLVSRGISHGVFRSADFKIVLEKVRNKTLIIKSVVDRASDVDENCDSIVDLLRKRGLTS